MSGGFLKNRGVPPSHTITYGRVVRLFMLLVSPNAVAHLWLIYSGTVKLRNKEFYYFFWTSNNSQLKSHKA